MQLYKDLEHSSCAYPERIALSCENHLVTYLELKERVDALSHGLKAAGITQGMRIGLSLHNSVDFIVCLYAFARNNNIVCLLNTHLTPDDLEIKLRSAKLDVVIMENYVYATLLKNKPYLDKDFRIILRSGAHNRKMTLGDISSNRNFVYHQEEASVEDDGNVLIQSSSGTTGISKMAYRTNRNLSVDTDNIITTLNYTSDDVIYCATPLCHGFGLTMGLIAPIKCGATIHIERWFMANRFLSIYNDLKPTIFIGTPEIYDSLNRYMANFIYSFCYKKWFLCSSSLLSEEIGLNFFKISGHWLNQVYGMMEASTISANLDARRDNFLSLGKPVNNVSVKITLDGEKSGEIFVKSEAVSRTYIRSGQCMELPAQDGWFGTRDMGFMDTGGNIFITGRKES